MGGIPEDCAMLSLRLKTIEELEFQYGPRWVEECNTPVRDVVYKMLGHWVHNEKQVLKVMMENGNRFITTAVVANNKVSMIDLQILGAWAERPVAANAVRNPFVMADQPLKRKRERRAKWKQCKKTTTLCLLEKRHQDSQK